MQHKKRREKYELQVMSFLQQTASKKLPVAGLAWNGWGKLTTICCLLIIACVALFQEY